MHAAHVLFPPTAQPCARRTLSSRVYQVPRPLNEAGWDHPAHNASRSTPSASAMSALDRSWPSTTARW
eukprot:62733-Pleurochrysis_carterae.AAC.1